jgi:hypothetical protein
MMINILFDFHKNIGSTLNFMGKGKVSHNMPPKKRKKGDTLKTQMESKSRKLFRKLALTSEFRLLAGRIKGDQGASKLN